MRIYVCPLARNASNEVVAGISLLPGVTRCRAVIAALATGPKHTWTLCYVEATSWTAIDARADCHRLDDNLDNSLNNTIRDRLATRGVATREVTDQIPTVRALLKYLIRENYPDATFASVFPEIAAIRGGAEE